MPKRCSLTLHIGMIFRNILRNAVQSLLFSFGKTLKNVKVFKMLDRFLLMTFKDMKHRLKTGRTYSQLYEARERKLKLKIVQTLSYKLTVS